MTYEDRIKRIKKPEDITEQIRLADAYAVRLRRDVERNSRLSDKIEAHKKLKLAIAVIQKLRVFSSYKTS